MAAQHHTVRLNAATYRELAAEAARRHAEPDQLAEQFVRDRLPRQPQLSTERVLAELDALSACMPAIDAVSVVRQGREELEWRSA